MATSIYQRVSTTCQNQDSQRNLTDDFAKTARDRGEEVHVHTDTCSGTKNMQRPAFKKMLDQMRRGDCLVVARLDRLGRTARGIVTLLDELRARGIRFLSLSEGIDADTLTGRLMYQVLGAVAEFELELRRSRIEAAHEARRKRGETINKGGRPKGTPDKLTPKRLALVSSLHAEGRTVTEITHLCGFGSRNTTYAALKQLQEVKKLDTVDL